jgi:hypothetical protein
MVANVEQSSKEGFEKAMQGFQGSETFKLLQQGYQIGTGQKDNPFAGMAKGDKMKDGRLATLEEFYTSGYGPGGINEDPKVAALRRARRAAASSGQAPSGGGPGGTQSPAAASILKDSEGLAPGANPWMV